MVDVVEQVFAVLKNAARRLFSTEIKAKSTVWACFHRKMAQEHSYRVRDKQVLNEDSVVFPECRAATLHGEHFDPKRTSPAFFHIRGLRSTARCSRATLLAVDMTVYYESNTCI